MASGDYLYRFMFEQFGVRGEFVRLDASWQAVRERHEYPDYVETELGKALAAVSMLSGTIKFKGSLVMQVQSSGPIQGVVAQVTDQRTIRGMAHFDNAIPKQEASAFGDGRLILTAEAPSGERYQGIVALEGGNIGSALEGYFQQSEQLDTRLWLAANSDHAVGLFLQKMPDQSPEADDWERVVMLADTIKDEELFDLEAEEILHRLFHEDDLRLFDPEPIAFRCGCSRGKIEAALISMGQAEVDAVLKEQGAIDAHCEFCNAHYQFDTVDVAALFNVSSMNASETKQ